MYWLKDYPDENDKIKEHKFLYEKEIVAQERKNLLKSYNELNVTVYTFLSSQTKHDFHFLSKFAGSTNGKIFICNPEKYDKMTMSVILGLISANLLFSNESSELLLNFYPKEYDFYLPKVFIL